MPSSWRRPFCGVILLLLSCVFPAYVAGTITADQLLSVKRIATVPGLPTCAASVPGEPSTFFITTLTGEVHRLANGVFSSNGAFKEVNVYRDPTSQTDQRGLLWLAFSPNYLVDKKYYLRYSDWPPINSTYKSTSVIVEFRTDDPSYNRTLFTLPQQSIQNVGGYIGFDPADPNLLFASFGEGVEDADIPPAQNISLPFGSIIRMDISTTRASIPASNPFPGSFVWANGFKNPFQCSFDASKPSDFYCSENGIRGPDEINKIVKGGNYGWPIYEGNGCRVGGPSPCTAPSDYIPPLTIYDKSTGVAAIGGFVYRGSNPSMASLQGAYIFGDLAGKVFALQKNADDSWQRYNLTNTELESQTIINIIQGEDLELYALTFGPIISNSGTPIGYDGGVYKLDGVRVLDLVIDNTPSPSPTRSSALGISTSLYVVVFAVVSCVLMVL